MRKTIQILLLNFNIFFACESDIKKTEDLEICFTGKLVKKGICMNYVIQVMDENFDKKIIEITWRDDSSKQDFQNVFTLGSVCDFPSDMSEGDLFNFSILDYYDKQCAVCLAYTPTPKKSINIIVC